MKILPLLVLLLLPVSTVSAQQTEIPIGFIGPLTGDAAHFGIEARNAVDIAVNEINSKDYVPGIRLKVIYEDGRCNGRDATSAARKLVDIDHVPVILGGLCSSETLAAANVTETAKVILFSSFSSNPLITNSGDFVFRNCVNDLEGGARAARLVKERGYKRPAAISENTDFTLGLRNAFTANLSAYGLNAVADETYNTPDTDFRSILLKVNSRNPDVIFLSPQSGVKGGLLARQIRNMKLPAAIIGNNVFAAADAGEAAGGIEKLEGMLLVDAPATTTPRAMELLREYRELYGEQIQAEYSIAFSYDAAYLMADAIRNAGLDTEKIRDYLYNLSEFKGVAYSYHFDGNGDVVGVSYVAKQIRGGKIEQLD